MSKKEIPVKQCSDCGSPRIVYDEETGEHICLDCGLVVSEDYPFSERESRTFVPELNAKKRRPEVSKTYSSYDKGLYTIIRLERDAFGRKLSPEVKNQIFRLRKWQTRSRKHTSKARNLLKAMNELQRISDKLHIPSSVREMAAVIYRRALYQDLVRGRTINGVVAAALYVACRFTKTHRTLKEIAEISLGNKKEISRDYRLLLRNLKISMPIDEPLFYVSKIAEQVGISGQIQGIAIRIIKEAQAKHITTGKDPSGLAGAALYLACRLKKQKITKKQIAEAAEISTVTIGHNMKFFLPILEDVKRTLGFGSGKGRE